MTLDEFVNKWDGQIADWDKAYGGQCVDLYRYYCDEVLKIPQSPGVEGAYQIWDTYLKDKFTRIENTPEGIPQKGDIMIWYKTTYRPFGHVSIFLEGNVNQFTSFDQNSPIGSPCHRQGHTYSGVQGWLRPKGGLTSVTYKGLDLTNQESMKVAVDMWYAVVQEGKYVEKTDVEHLKEDFRNELEYKQSLIEAEAHRYKQFTQDLANILGSGSEEPEIVAEIKKLINTEDLLTGCRDDKRELEKKIVSETARAEEILNELSVQLGTTVASSKGISRALATYLKSNQANPILDDYSISDILFNLYRRITSWRRNR